MQRYSQLFLNSTKSKNKNYGKSFVFAFTSAAPEEGVSYVAQSFAADVARLTGKRTLIADAKSLMRANIAHYSRISRFCFQTEIPNLRVLPPNEAGDKIPSPNGLVLQTNKMGNYLETSLDNLATFRFAFDYVLIDCPALSESGEAALLAPETDGVIIVVEADHTKREQIRAAQKKIETANGNLLGFVLNKRQYPVPGWIYKRL